MSSRSIFGSLFFHHSALRLRAFSGIKVLLLRFHQSHQTQSEQSAKFDSQKTKIVSKDVWESEALLRARSGRLALTHAGALQKNEWNPPPRVNKFSLLAAGECVRACLRARVRKFGVARRLSLVTARRRIRAAENSAARCLSLMRSRLFAHLFAYLAATSSAHFQQKHVITSVCQTRLSRS